MLTERLKIRPGVYERGEFRFGEAVEAFLEAFSDGSAGAALIFIGIVKSFSKDGRDVAAVEIEAYKEHADKSIQKICEEVGKKHGVTVGVWHLVGEFGVGQPLVMVAVAGKSRYDVYPALMEAVERYKKEPALFKKEVYVDGSYQWIT